MASGKIEMTGQRYITRDIYVDATNGNDANNGQYQASAVKTFNGIRKCLEEYADEYILMFNSGTYTCPADYGAAGLQPANKRASFSIYSLSGQNVVIDAYHYFYIHVNEFHVLVGSNSTLTLNKIISVFSEGGNCSIHMGGAGATLTTTSSGSITFGTETRPAGCVNIALQGGTGATAISLPLAFYSGPIHVLLVNGTGTISGNLFNYGAGIMKLPAGITYSGTATGIRIQNGVFYPS